VFVLFAWSYLRLIRGILAGGTQNFTYRPVRICPTISRRHIGWHGAGQVGGDSLTRT
jgi:hypothetical protein